jgi:TPR repeat protein
MRSRLDLLDIDLADQVHAIDDDRVLRLFACECASLALKHCGDRDPRLTRAVEIARDYAKGIADSEKLGIACADADRAAQAADNAAFDAQDAFEAGTGTESEYTKAFGAARAAFSARDCCLGPAIVAASNAAYEASHALGTAIEEGATLHGLVPSDLCGDAEIDAAIVVVLRDILERLR